MWHCLVPGYTPGSGTVPGASMLSWGGAGMAGWGATCGIAIACAQFAQMVLPNATANATIDKIFAYYAEGNHPFNAEWFITGKAHPRAATDFQVQYGSLQCHNVVAQHRNREEFLTLCGNNPDTSRGEFCSTLVGAVLYETMKQVGTTKLMLPAIPKTDFSTVRNGCSVAGCHQNYLTAGFTPKENCYACHK